MEYVQSAIVQSVGSYLLKRSLWDGFMGPEGLYKYKGGGGGVGVGGKMGGGGGAYFQVEFKY